MSEVYFQKVRENVVKDVIGAGKGMRNEALNKAAFTIGRHAHLSPAHLDDAITDLHIAAKQIGLHDIEIKPTIGSGFKRGGENPKQLENSDTTPYTPSEMDRLIGRLAAKELLARDDETRQDKIAKAKQAWDRAVPIEPATKDACRPALLYLNSRGLRAASAVNVARFSPNVYDGPAIIFPALNGAGEVEGIQAVLLTQDGKKREHNGISKYSRGVIAGNVMRLGSEHEGAAIIMTEGPEDALSVRQATMDYAEATILCTFGKAGMSSYNVPRASDVTICADPDLDVDAVADVLRGDGSTSVHVVRFDKLGVENVKDANDYLKEAGAEKLREALATAKPVEEVKQEIAAAERSWPTLYEWIDPSSIKARRWIYGSHYIRGYVSVLASAGGIGKTSMVQIEALSICTGKPLLGEAVKEQCKVWLINLEDPEEEMVRRMAAAVMHYDIKPEEIAGQLFMDAGRDLKMMFAKQSSAGIEIMDEIVDYMIAKVKELGIGMIIIDPWVGANAINENDNVAMNAAVSAVRRVADETDCGVCLVHHIRKTNGEDATVDSVRGAGSLIGAARAARIINRIDADEAMKLGVSENEATGIFRVDDGKANLAPPAAKAVYRRMVGVKLPNGEYVGVATEFKMPDLFDGITAKDARKVQKEVGAAVEENRPPRDSVQATDWVGHIVARVLDLDMEKSHEKARVKAVIKKWIETDVLRREMVPSKRDGREVPSIIVGQWITREEAGL
jgi:RecA-family ATPase